MQRNRFAHPARPLIARLIVAFAVVWSLAAHSEAARESEYGPDAAASDPSAQVVMFLTQTDPMIAGHALHMAGVLGRHGHSVTVVLVGEAGEVAQTGGEPLPSAVGPGTLHDQLQALLDAGVEVHMTPFTRRALDGEAGPVLDAVSHPRAGGPMPQRLTAPNARVLVW